MIVNFIDGQMNPGQEFLVIHFELMRARDWFVVGVLDGSNDSLCCTNAGEMLGKSNSKLDGGELDVEG